MRREETRVTRDAECNLLQREDTTRERARTSERIIVHVAHSAPKGYEDGADDCGHVSVLAEPPREFPSSSHWKLSRMLVQMVDPDNNRWICTDKAEKSPSTRLSSSACDNPNFSFIESLYNVSA